MSYWAEKRVPTLDPGILERLPDEVPRWKVAYWQFQNQLTRSYIVPFLRAADALPVAGRILEVGAGEGGCLAALHELTGLPSHGLELSGGRIHLAGHLNQALAGGALRLTEGDIADAGSLSSLEPPYSLILLRDVIEHVEDLDAALGNLFDLLDDGAVVLFTFPPYLSAYGAHQQILGRAWLRLPWLQLCPFFPALVRRGESLPGTRAEIESLRRCSLTIGRFERAFRRLPYELVMRRHYLVRPAFRYRYGLPPVSGALLSRIPGLREIVMTGCWYLLRRPRERDACSRD